MNDAKRQEIKSRIATAQDPVTGETRTGPAGAKEYSFVAFAKDHPVLTVASGLAAGILVAGLFPSARRTAYKGGSRASAIGAAGASALLSALNNVLETASDAGRAGGEKLGTLGDALGDTARSAGRGAHDLADRTGDSARIATRGTRKAVARSLHRLLG